MRKIAILGLAVGSLLMASCGGGTAPKQEKEPEDTQEIQKKVDAFAEVSLSSNIDHLTESERQMLSIFYRVGQLMNEIFWEEAYGDKVSLLDSLPNDAYRAFANINYGPWERLNGNTPFVAGFGAKPAGAQFYPADMTEEEFNACPDEAKNSMYTVLRRDENGKLKVIPYHEFFKEKIEVAATLLDSAAQLAEDPGLKNYLRLRAEALRTDDYKASDLAWMDMKNNRIDFVVGPIENYEDHMFGTKAAHESFILIKDLEWSEKLNHYMSLLPQLQANLPVDAEYKAEKPATSSDLGAYDVVYYGGDCNAGSKTIAINLPNDPEVQLEKGSRRLQLKNAMKYKFDLIMLPIAKLLIDPSQAEHVKFPAFFENTMFHEVAHGLGIKQTLKTKKDVREELGEAYSAIEEGKADILGLFMVEQLVKMGELKEHDLMDNYVTFLAGIFRSVRFGAASAHGKANMVRFHFFQEKGAFTKDAETGYYKVNAEHMSKAVAELAHDILVLQGDGNREGAQKLLREQGVVDAELQNDLDRISEANIPIDIVYNQGPEVLGIPAFQQ